MKDLKEGDKVFVKSFGITLATVKSVTQNGHIETRNDEIYVDGKHRVDDNNTKIIVPWTQELQYELDVERRLRYLISGFNKINPMELELEQLQSIYDIVNE